MTSTDHVLHCEAYSEQPSFFQYVYQSNVIFVLTGRAFEKIPKLPFFDWVSDRAAIRPFGLQAGDLSLSPSVCQMLLSQITKSVKQ